MAFNLADVLKDVSSSDTGREQIEYIRLDLIDSDSNNFYQLTDIEALADNISLCGLQQPIRVRPVPGESERYVIVSGHRRRAAIELLAKDDSEKWQEAACIVERDAVSPALQQLRLIYANASTRKLTPAEISEQAVQVEKLLYQLKEEEGYEFPGRMRDHVAQAVGVSKTKLARLKVIRENLAKCWMTSFKKNEINESTAYALAQMSREDQRSIFDGLMAKNGHMRYLTEKDINTYKQRFDAIGELKCDYQIFHPPCKNMFCKKTQAVQTPTYYVCACGKCCKDCIELVGCKNACPHLAGTIKELKADRKEARRLEKQVQAEKDRPQIEQIQSLWLRFGYLRDKAGKTVKEVFDAADICYHKDDDKKYASFEDCTAKVTTSTKLPYTYSCYLSDVQRFIAIADLFGCSIDYMLCRTDYPELVKEAPAEKVSDSDTSWKTGRPERAGRYVVMVKFSPGKEGTPQKLDWDGEDWTIFGESVGVESSQIIGWMPMPEG